MPPGVGLVDGSRGVRSACYVEPDAIDSGLDLVDLDPTADQFDTPVDYAAGRGRGFPTPRQGRREQPPSKRAQLRHQKSPPRKALTHGADEAWLRTSRSGGWRRRLVGQDK
jgi:hypothetical protein